ncbi:MAG: hypothetical protein JXB24_07700, partial [Bacteroidales bacterium]|nr:hypothetical protein [Bacteroidales bacterium]
IEYQSFVNSLSLRDFVAILKYLPFETTPLFFHALVIKYYLCIDESNLLQLFFFIFIDYDFELFTG